MSASILGSLQRSELLIELQDLRADGNDPKPLILYYCFGWNIFLRGSLPNKFVSYTSPTELFVATAGNHITMRNENSLPPSSSSLGFHPFPLWLLLPLISLPLNSPLPLPPCVVASCSPCVVCIVVCPASLTFHAPTSCLAPSNRGGVILWPERSDNGS